MQLSYTKKNQGDNMNDQIVQEPPKAKPLFDADQFVRESPVWRRMQYDILKANLRRVANDQGFEVLHISHRHHPAVELSLYLGTEEQHHDHFRLRSNVCRFLNAAAIQVPPFNVFARYRRAVVRTCFVPQWD